MALASLVLKNRAVAAGLIILAVAAVATVALQAGYLLDQVAGSSWM
jgi:hypothetical protein